MIVEIKNLLSSVRSDVSNNKLAYFVSVGIVFAVTFRFFAANIYYMDDMLRGAWGYDWNVTGRILSSYLYKMLSLSPFVFDFSPFSQFAAVGLVALSAYLLGMIFLPKQVSLLVRISFILLVTLNPYILQIYSYRFDALPYSIGFFLVVAGYVVLYSANDCSKIVVRLVFYILSCLLLLGGTLFYQPTASIFLVSLLFQAVIANMKDQSSTKIVLNLFVGLFITAVALFISKSIANIYIPSHEPAHAYMGVNLNQLAVNIIRNIIESYRLLLLHWAWPTINLQGTIWLILFATGFLVISKILIIRVKVAKYFSAALLILILFSLFAVGGIGILIVLDHAHFEPRVFLVFGFSLAGIFAVVVHGLSNVGYGKLFIKLLAVGCACTVILFAPVWANAVTEQKRFADNVARNIVLDVTHYGAEYTVTHKNLFFIGRLPWSPYLPKHLFSSYPVMESLVKRYISEGDVYSYIYLMSVGLRSVDPALLNQPPPSISEMRLAKNCPEYKVYQSDENVVIHFKNK